MQTEPISIPALFGILTGYQRTAALKAAIDLDLFTAIAEGATTAPALAKRCEAAERGVRILADTLTVMGLLGKDGADYSLPPGVDLFLDRRAPTYVGAAVNFLSSPMLLAGFSDVAPAVRKGGTAIPDEGSTAPEHPMWINFARSMSGLSTFTGALVASLLGDSKEKWKVLDVAAGHGQFGIAVARSNPNAEIVALDWQNVLTVAEENATAAGISSRFRKLAGNAFDVDFGTGYDVILIPNFLHHFDPPTCVAFLKKVHAALKPGGRAVTVEFVPNPDRISPPEAASFALVMLVTTPAGDAYTFAELERMCRSAGFATSELHSLAPTPHHAIVSTK